MFCFTLVVGKRNAAIKSRAEAACRLCRDGAVKSPRSGIKAENGKLIIKWTKTHTISTFLAQRKKIRSHTPNLSYQTDIAISLLNLNSQMLILATPSTLDNKHLLSGLLLLDKCRREPTDSYNVAALETNEELY